jgi:hypothetical protein
MGLIENKKLFSAFANRKILQDKTGSATAGTCPAAAAVHHFAAVPPNLARSQA